ncbi:MAG: hypothetical protein L3J96_02850, partial [Thermoplasmata archaeon]|nr:hypothetical protein [Thermoplasmata archaeon]
AGPMLPSAFNAWVNVVVSADGGWVVAGAGYLANGSIGPELVWLGSTSSGPEVDMSGQLPASFAGGQVQFGGLANAYPAPTILLVGQGGVRQPTQQSHGAVAELTLGCR